MITINKEYEERIFIGKPVGEDGDLIDRESGIIKEKTINLA
jgi:hypothetical protein